MDESDSAALIAALRTVPLFAGLKESQFGWVAGGEDLRLDEGDILVREGEPNGDFFALLEGAIEWSTLVGGQPVHFATHHAPAFFGHEPILMDIPIPVTGRADEPSRLFRLAGRERFWEMVETCPAITRELLTTIAQRNKSLEAVAQGQGKLAALGTMAAGLAHELNNPAAAARRAADALGGAVRAAPLQTLALLEHHPSLSPSLLTELLGEAEACARAAAGAASGEGALARADREERLGGWLDEHAVDDAWDLAPSLAEGGLDTVWLDRLVARVPVEALGETLRWLETGWMAAQLAGEVRHSTGRISDLVQSVKAYSYMDRAPQQAVDVQAGLDSTLTMLGHKLRAKGAKIVREYDRALPRIEAYGGELNQVWTNLLDNAADAVGLGGTVRVRATCEGDRVLVEIGDDGPGIPPEVRARLFEPFFTTKGVGQGTGLGLMTSQRIVVGRHKGDIRVESRPGDTRFQVRLPVSPPR